MREHGTREADGLAPHGSPTRLLLSGERGERNHFTLPPGATSTAVAHKTIQELWYFLNGTDQLWRRRGEHEAIVDVGPGVCLNIPTGVRFQFRSTGDELLRFFVATMPPRPGDDRPARSTVLGKAQLSPDSLDSAEVAEFAKGLVRPLRVR